MGGFSYGMWDGRGQDLGEDDRTRDHCTIVLHKSCSGVCNCSPHLFPVQKLHVTNILHDHDVGFTAADWEYLGLQLKILESVLNTIKEDHSDDPECCLKDMASSWMQTESDASWEKLVEAVPKVEKYGESDCRSCSAKGWDR